MKLLIQRTFRNIQPLRERLSEKKHQSARDKAKKVIWVFTGILHISLQEINMFVFLHVENLFSRRMLISVAFLISVQ